MHKTTFLKTREKKNSLIPKFGTGLLKFWVTQSKNTY